MQFGKLWSIYNQIIIEGQLKKDPAQEKIVSALAALEEHLEIREEQTKGARKTGGWKTGSWKTGVGTKGRTKGGTKSVTIRGGVGKTGVAIRGGVGKTGVATKRVAIRGEVASKGFWTQIFKAKNQDKKKNQLYIHGTVGRGKTLLMKLFYDNLILTNKKFLHYHLFMRNIHETLFEIRKNEKLNLNPVTIAAKKNLKNTGLLCLDEFFVNDIADATILYKLFQYIFDAGITTVVTSNTPPQNLYEKGTNRHLISPFIELIEEKMKVINLDGHLDWRKSNQVIDNIYNLSEKLDDQNQVANKIFLQIWQNFPGKETQQSIKVCNRKLTFKHTKEKILKTTFTKLCFSEYAAADYLAICEKFDIVMLEGLQHIDTEAHDIITRLIIVTDIFYNAGIIVIILADVFIDEIYQSSWSDSGFQRMLSRLYAMRTFDYLHNKTRNTKAKKILIKFLNEGDIA